MFASVHVYIFKVVIIYCLPSNVSQILEVAFLFPVSIFLYICHTVDISIASYIGKNLAT